MSQLKLMIMSQNFQGMMVGGLQRSPMQLTMTLSPSFQLVASFIFGPNDYGFPKKFHPRPLGHDYQIFGLIGQLMGQRSNQQPSAGARMKGP